MNKVKVVCCYISVSVRSLSSSTARSGSGIALPSTSATAEGLELALSLGKENAKNRAVKFKHAAKRNMIPDPIAVELPSALSADRISTGPIPDATA